MLGEISRRARVVGRAQVGPVVAELAGRGSVAEALGGEFGLPEMPGSRPHLELLLQPASSPDSSSQSTHRGRRFPYRYTVDVTDAGIEYSFGARVGPPFYTVVLDGVPFDADRLSAQLFMRLAGHPARQLVNPLCKVLTRDFASTSDALAKNVIYEIVDPLLLAVMLRKGATLVHSGAVVNHDGVGVLLMGTGGVGKTTTVLDLVLNRGWRYLGDDLVVLSDQGLQRYPKRLQVYAYNLDLVPELAPALLDGRGPVDRGVWKARLAALGPSNVRRRVSASRLFGPSSVADGASLGLAVKLSSAPDIDRVTVAEVSARDLARQASSVILDEFWDFFRFTNALASMSPGAPTVSEVQQQVASVLERALERVRCVEVLVPPRTPGAAISEALDRSVLKDLPRGVGQSVPGDE